MDIILITWTVYLIQTVNKKFISLSL